MIFTNRETNLEMSNDEYKARYNTNRLEPITAAEPEPDEVKEAEILAMWQAHDEAQRALNEAWAAYHKACRNFQHHKFRQERMELEREQARLNAEREALPPRPMVGCSGGMSKAARMKLVHQIRAADGRGYGGW